MPHRKVPNGSEIKLGKLEFPVAKAQAGTGSSKWPSFQAVKIGAEARKFPQEKLMGAEAAWCARCVLTVARPLACMSSRSPGISMRREALPPRALQRKEKSKS